MKLKIKKQNTILISLLALSLAACNGGGGGSSGGSSGGDTPPSPPTPTTHTYNGLTMTVKQKSNNDTKVNLAKTFGHSQYYLIVTNNNDQAVKWGTIQYDTYFESTVTKPITSDITKYVMNYDGLALKPDGEKYNACQFNVSSAHPTSFNTLQPGESCVYQLNAMWADNQNTATSIFNWKMSYGLTYGSDTKGKWVGKDCSVYPLATCASAAEIESADNNQNLSYYLPNHSNAIGSSIGTYLNSVTDYDYQTGGSNTPVTNMNGDILWVPSATAYIGSVAQFSLNYDSSTNTLAKGSFLNSYVGGTDWLKGAASSNLAGDAFFQYNHANDVTVEPMAVSMLGWMPGLDGSMYASSGNNAYGVLKVTPDGNGGYISIRLPDDFKSPTNNIVQAIGANGNILTADYNSYANYCYVNNGNNTYTKTQVATTAGAQLRGVIFAGLNYVYGTSTTMANGTTYLGFDGNSINPQPYVYTKINMNNCTPDYSSYLTNKGVNGAHGSVDGITNQYVLIQVTGATRVANINTLSNGTDGN